MPFSASGVSTAEQALECRAGGYTDIRQNILGGGVGTGNGFGDHLFHSFGIRRSHIVFRLIDELANVSAGILDELLAPLDQPVQTGQAEIVQ